MTEKNCVACNHAIDAAAKICPYCGADPDTGHKVDTKPIVDAHFPPKPERAPTESVLAFVRQRQGIVVTTILIAAFLVLTLLHQFISKRSEDELADVPAISLTEIADLGRQAENGAELPLPEAKFTYDGSARTMKTFLIEPGAVAPAPPAAAPAPGAAAGTVPPASPTPAARPGVAPNPLQQRSPAPGTNRQ
jgi:hypothetical protein